MQKNIGIWIDHEKAFLVSIQDKRESSKKIQSEVESHIKALGGSRPTTPYGPQEASAEKKLDERRKQQLHKFYQKILPELREISKIYIFGPGEAKHELDKEIKKSKELSLKRVKIETADKMTENQIKARVKNYFEEV
jgi:hypothetical protein